jgi:hypothetical protein
MIYLKIKNNSKIEKQESVLKTIIRKIIELLIPKANPDYENKIDFVVYWLLEFENAENIPVREIGIGINENVLVKMPHLNNYGYWTDNNLTYNDFKSLFNTVDITRNDFYEKWEQ